MFVLGGMSFLPPLSIPFRQYSLMNKGKSGTFSLQLFQYFKRRDYIFVFSFHYFCSVFDSNLTTSSATMRECSI